MKSPFFPRGLLNIARSLILLALFVNGLALMRHIVCSVVPGMQVVSSAASQPVAENPEAKVRAASELSPPEPGSPAEEILEALIPAVIEPSAPIPGNPAASSAPVPSPVPAVPASVAKPRDAAKSRGEFPFFMENLEGRFIVTELIEFDVGIPVIRPASFNALDKLVALLQEHREIELTIIGHMDNLRPEPVTQQLSEQRAASVMKYLVSHGIEASRLESKGMGSRYPIATNDTLAGRAINRRTVFMVRGPR